MSDPTNDIDALLHDVAHFPVTHARVAALVAERNALRAENEAQSYEGNSASHWAASSKVYGNCISDCWKVLMLAGFPPNGNIDIVASLTALVAERDALKQERDQIADDLKWLRLESRPHADRDRELRERLIESALQGAVCETIAHQPAAELLGRQAVWLVDGALAAMRKGVARE